MQLFSEKKEVRRDFFFLEEKAQKKEHGFVISSNYLKRST